mmetsp:Transcript_50708/g.151748  ORF Transcript_50708/g.151748 Transcript_50708/m.151748 type:complete len:208 (-) Transcript_50708:18-641(-)
MAANRRPLPPGGSSSPNNPRSGNQSLAREGPSLSTPLPARGRPARRCPPTRPRPTKPLEFPCDARSGAPWTSASLPCSPSGPSLPSGAALSSAATSWPAARRCSREGPPTKVRLTGRGIRPARCRAFQGPRRRSSRQNGPRNTCRTAARRTMHTVYTTGWFLHRARLQRHLRTMAASRLCACLASLEHPSRGARRRRFLPSLGGRGP